ncbi:hypothetical protein F5Y05DRAFT_183760 [Hypoxylon sp. FL0543]|nr:hypothetical protein F5Y05DRAFT_183760 [Hypoxylon sp. FL0543]
MSVLTPPSLDDLRSAAAGKVVVVTGAAHGIGFATAELFARAGAKVVIADVNQDVGDKAAAELGGSTIFVKCDVSSWEDQTALFQKAIATHGRVDLLVCNAGINPELMFSNGTQYDYLREEYEEDKPDVLRAPSTKVLDVNVLGAVYGVKLAIHHMSRSGGGRVICLGSLASYMAVPEQTLYCASKHAILGLVRATSKRKECLDNGISISMVAPSLTDTRMTAAVPQSARGGVLVSSPRDIAAAVSILAAQAIEESRGKCVWVQGKTCTEVEEVLFGAVVKLLL